MGVVPREVESEWIYRWAQTIDLRTLANVQALPSIRQSDVAALEIPMPPLDTRRAIAARLEAESFSATRLCATLAAKFMEVEKLPAALLRAAFQPCRRLAPI
jgi:restriction endonuclease S subunit